MSYLLRISLIIVAVWCLLRAEACLGDAGHESEAPFFAGALYSDNSGLRGYNMPVDVAEVLGEGKWGISLETDASNYWNYCEWYDGRYLSTALQIFEIQTAAVNLRTGVNLGTPLELGLRMPLQQRNPGILNGFIEWFEGGLFGKSRNQYLVNSYRVGYKPIAGNYDFVSIESHTRELEPFSEPRLGDGMFTVKKCLADSGLQRCSFRMMVNLPFGGEYSNGHYAGLGLGLDQPSPWQRLVFHLDGRAVVPFEGENSYGLELSPFSLGLTAGFEWNVDDLGFWVVRFPGDTSLEIQVNSNQSPFQTTCVWFIDVPQNDFTFGFSHGFQAGPVKGTWQIWGREDFIVDTSWSVPVELLPYSPPDFQAGIRVSINK